MVHESLTFSELDENLFQGILVVSATGKVCAAEWLKRIIENARNKSNLEFQPVLDQDAGIKMLRFDSPNLSTGRHPEPVRCHSAMLDNKYYATQIYLVELDRPVEFPDRFYDFIHGIIIYFDNDDIDCLKSVDKWVQYIDLMENCAIKILACERATEHNAVSRIDVQSYCFDKGFELVELSPEDVTAEENDQDILEDDFKEMNSFERLYKAIQAYVWPNLNYKEKNSSMSSTAANDTLIKQINQLNFGDSGTAIVGAGENGSTTVNYETLTNQEPIGSTAQSDGNHISGSTDTGSQSHISEREADQFENVFAKFSEMKENASRMADGDRKTYAEQVAIAFWNSISDDHDEVLFESDDEDDGDEKEARKDDDDDQDPSHVYV